MTERLQEPGAERVLDSGLAIEAVILGRVALLVLVTGMAVLFSGSTLGFDRQFPFWFFLFAVGVLGLAYRRVQRSGGGSQTLLATPFLVGVGTASYLAVFSGGAGSPFLPPEPVAAPLGGVLPSLGRGRRLA